MPTARMAPAVDWVATVAPTAFLQRDDGQAIQCEQLVKELFSWGVRRACCLWRERILLSASPQFAAKQHETRQFGPLSELLLQGFDDEQV